MAELAKHLIITTLGEQLKRDAVILGNPPISLKYLAVGDGGGTSYGLPKLDPDYQTLQNEIYRDQILGIEVLENNNKGKFLVTGFIPKDVLGSVYLKEVGLFTRENQLIFAGHLDNYFKPSITSARTASVVIQVEIDWGFVYGLDLDDNRKYEFATKSDLTNENDPLTGYSISKPYLYFMSQISQHNL